MLSDLLKPLQDVISKKVMSICSMFPGSRSDVPMQGHKGMMRKDELGTSITAKSQQRKLAVLPETCVTAHGLD
eukprot:13823598-Ditylum_brightwellii.AAC.1